MATDDVQLFLGAVDNVTAVIESIERRVEGLGEAASKITPFASLGRAAASARILGDAFDGVAAAIEESQRQGSTFSGTMTAFIKELPIVGGLATSVERLADAFLGVSREAEIAASNIERLRQRGEFRDEVDKFTAGLLEELHIRQALAKEADSTERQIILLREEERKQLEEIDKLEKDIRRSIPQGEDLRTRRLQVQRTIELEINRIIEDRIAAENETAARLVELEQERAKRELDVQMDAAFRREQAIMDMESNIQALRLRNAGELEEAELEGIRRRSDRAIAEAQREGDERLVQLLVEQRREELIASIRKNKATARPETLPELRAVESRLGRGVTNDPVARAAQQTAQNTQKLGQIATGIQQIVNNQQAAMRDDNRVEARL